jgi:hypothetical protein
MSTDLPKPSLATNTLPTVTHGSPDIVELWSKSRSWLLRRTDHLDFLDLMTVHRTITLTLDWGAEPLGRADEGTLIPVGLLRRHAGRASLRVANEHGIVLPHLTRDASEEAVGSVMEGRFEALTGKLEASRSALAHIRSHSLGNCEQVGSDDRGTAGASLSVEKWGCPAAIELVREVLSIQSDDRDIFIRALFDWQNSSFLLVSAPPSPDRWSTVIVSYDEELQEWETPFDRRCYALQEAGSVGEGDQRLKEGAKPAEISRGGPFRNDLNELAPTAQPRRFLSTQRVSASLRRQGRRDLLGQLWHVAWEQLTAQDVGSYHVEVSVPQELDVVRMRMLSGGTRNVRTGDQLGRRAHLVAPNMKEEAQGTSRRQPAFISILLARTDENVWLTGALVSALTGGALCVGAADVRVIMRHDDPTATVLSIVPALVLTLLSFRASSDLGAALTGRLSGVLGLAAGVTVFATAALAAVSKEHPCRLAVIWVVLGLFLVCIAGLLFLGWVRAHKLMREMERGEPGLKTADHGERLKSSGKRVAAPPPDRWLAAGEGERIPWGWLDSGFGPEAEKIEDAIVWKCVFGQRFAEQAHDLVERVNPVLLMKDNQREDK